MNELINIDCIEYMKTMLDESVDLTLTDIPYDVVSRESGGLRILDFKDADVLTFNILDFLTEVYRVTKGTIIIFCAKEQLSEIYKFFADKQKENKGTV